MNAKEKARSLQKTGVTDRLATCVNEAFDHLVLQVNMTAHHLQVGELDCLVECYDQALLKDDKSLRIITNGLIERCVKDTFVVQYLGPGHIKVIWR